VAPAAVQADRAHSPASAPHRAAAAAQWRRRLFGA
jgi:hypothetical protein